MKNNYSLSKLSLVIWYQSHNILPAGGDFLFSAGGEQITDEQCPNPIRQRLSVFSLSCTAFFPIGFFFSLLWLWNVEGI